MPVDVVALFLRNLLRAILLSIQDFKALTNHAFSGPFKSDLINQFRKCGMAYNISQSAIVSIRETLSRKSGLS